MLLQFLLDTKLCRNLLVGSALALGSAGALQAADKAANLHEVKPGPLRLDVTLDGVLVPQDVTLIKVEAKAWPQFQVKEAVKHGTVVREGDTLLKFERDEIDQAIEELEHAQKMSELTLEEAEEDFKRFKKLNAMELDAATLAWEAKQDEVRRRETIGKKRQEEDLARVAKRNAKAMEYAQEELKQLEKMYEQDELVEETEQMMLRRHRDQFEEQKFAYERFLEDFQYRKDVTLPREEAALRHDLEQARIIYETAKSKADAGLRAREFALRKQRLEHKRNDEKLAKMKADLDQFVLRAPCDGVVYYGRNVDGKWAMVGQMTERLAPGNKVGANEVLMTIVERGPLLARCVVPEKFVNRVRPGGVEISVPAYPGQPFFGRITEVSKVQVGPGMYLAQVALDSPPAEFPLESGMTCQVKTTAFAKKNALALPIAAVKRDDWSSDTYVTVVDGESEERRSVKLGDRTDTQVEVVSGLSKGDKVKLGGN